MEHHSEKSESEKINPELTQNFAAYISEKSRTGTYRVDVTVGHRVIPIDVFPNVFPPKSDYSASSKSVYESFGNLEDLEVAEIGSGTGIESIIAVLAGAKHVDAADIHQVAVECTTNNVELNNLSERIKVFHSDLFSNFPAKKYDLIIANLPIVNYEIAVTPISQALYDPHFLVHKGLLAEARSFLTKEGTVMFTHANLQSGKTAHPNYDFEELERVIKDYDYTILDIKSREELEYKWVNYTIKPK